MSFVLLKARFKYKDKSTGTLPNGVEKRCEITIYDTLCINHGIPILQNYCDHEQDNKTVDNA